MVPTPSCCEVVLNSMVPLSGAVSSEHRITAQEPYDSEFMIAYEFCLIGGLVMITSNSIKSNDSQMMIKII